MEYELQYGVLTITYTWSINYFVEHEFPYGIIITTWSINYYIGMQFMATSAGIQII